MFLGRSNLFQKKDCITILCKNFCSRNSLVFGRIFGMFYQLKISWNLTVRSSALFSDILKNWDLLL